MSSGKIRYTRGCEENERSLGDNQRYRKGCPRRVKGRSDLYEGTERDGPPECNWVPGESPSRAGEVQL